jgi:hypothetical protein
LILVSETETTAKGLDRSSALGLALNSLDRNPLGRLPALVQWQEDRALIQQLQQHQEEIRRHQAAILEGQSGFLQMQIRQMQKGMTDEAKRREAQRLASGQLISTEIWRRKARELLSAREVFLESFLLGVFLTVAFLLLFWPVLWIAWAFLTRGGLSYRFAGIALVGANGRPASRWRCAWRSLLVWLPIAVLLILSTWLDYCYVATLLHGEPRRWWSAAAQLCWYAALAVVLLYVGSALWRPTRTLHDYLSGVYLVPR